MRLHSLLLSISLFAIILLTSSVCFGQAELLRGDTTVILLEGGRYRGPISYEGRLVAGVSVGLRGRLNVGVTCLTALKGGRRGDEPSQVAGFVEVLPVRYGKRVWFALGTSVLGATVPGQSGNIGFGATLYLQGAILARLTISTYVGETTLHHGDGGTWYEQVNSGFALCARPAGGLMLSCGVDWARMSYQNATTVRGGVAILVPRRL